MPGAVCPFCFHPIDPSRLACQCTGRGDAECQKTTDAARKRLTGSTMATYPTYLPSGADNGPTVNCRVCGMRASRSACPECRTALPIDFREFGSPLIGLIGGKGSGKTVLATVLVKQLRDGTRKRFNADLWLDTDDPDGHLGEAVYLASREAPLFKSGMLPPSANAPGADAGQYTPPVLLRWRQKTTGLMGHTLTKSAMLSFIDTAGDDLVGVSKAFTVQYLSACDGLILVLNSFAVPGARDMLNLPGAAIQPRDEVPLDVVDTITGMLRTEHNLRAREKIAIPVAIVFTKMDAFFPTIAFNSPLRTSAPAASAYDDADGQAVHEHMLALLHKWNAQDINTHIRLNYKNYRYFGVSALGAEPDYEKSAVAPGGVRAHRVDDPVLWLLSETGAVKTARLPRSIPFLPRISGSHWRDAAMAP